MCWHYIQWTRAHLRVRYYIKNVNKGNWDEVAQGVLFLGIHISERHTRCNIDSVRLHFLCELGLKKNHSQHAIQQEHLEGLDLPTDQ